MKILWIWLLIINVIAYILMGDDKRRAVMKKWRIPEATLLLAAAVGGSVGELMGMLSFHHKTQKLKFALGVPLILIAQALLIIWLLR